MFPGLGSVISVPHPLWSASDRLEAWGVRALDLHSASCLQEWVPAFVARRDGAGCEEDLLPGHRSADWPQSSRFGLTD